MIAGGRTAGDIVAIKWTIASRTVAIGKLYDEDQLGCTVEISRSYNEDGFRTMNNGNRIMNHASGTRK